MSDDILPKSTMVKHIKDKLPGNKKIAGEAVDMIFACCNEFVHMVSTHANTISDKEKKTTITPEHIVRALEELDFVPYLGGVHAAWDEFKDEQKEATEKANSRKQARGNQGMSVEELAELQRKMFQQAKERTESTEGELLTDNANVPPSAPNTTEDTEQQQQQQQEQQQQDVPPDLPNPLKKLG